MPAFNQTPFVHLQGKNEKASKGKQRQRKVSQHTKTRSGHSEKISMLNKIKRKYTHTHTQNKSSDHKGNVALLTEIDVTSVLLLLGEPWVPLHRSPNHSWTCAASFPIR